MHSLKKPDGGWGWMVVLGCSGMHLIIGGIEKSFALIYLVLIEKFNSSASTTAYISSLGTFIRLFASPLSNALANRFSCRTVVLVGGILCGAGFILCALAESAYFLYFSYGIIFGMGGSLSYAPSIVAVGHYFDKKRGTANGLSTAGSGVGAFTLPFLIGILFDVYGYFGTMLILGGMVLNVCVCGALYRPLKITHDSAVVEQKGVPKLSENTTEAANKCLTVPESSHYRKHRSGVECNGNMDTKQSADSSQVIYIAELDSFSPGSQSMMPKVEAQFTKHEDTGKKNVKHFDWSLLKDVDFLFFGFTLFLSAMGTYGGVVLFGGIIKSRGHTEKSTVASLLAILGVFDLIGRIGSGILFDFKKIQPIRRHLFALTMFLTGAVLLLIPLAGSFGSFVVMACLYGLGLGVYTAQRPVMAADLMGQERLSSAIGLGLMFLSGGALGGPPLAGLLKDVYGNYSVSYYFTGSTVMVASVIFSVGNLRRRWCSSKVSNPEAGTATVEEAVEENTIRRYGSSFDFDDDLIMQTDSEKED